MKKKQLNTWNQLAITGKKYTRVNMAFLKNKKILIILLLGIATLLALVGLKKINFMVNNESGKKNYKFSQEIAFDFNEEDKKIDAIINKIRNNKLKRIILITIDPLRADFLGYNGFPLNTSPFLDELSKKSINYKNAFAQSPLTGPSEATIFTSLYPVQHGVLSDYLVLDDSYVTLAEILRDEGFKTAAFLGSDHITYGNLLQGFEHISLPSDINLSKKKRVRSFDESVELAYKWLNEQEKEEKVFLWLHSFDLHKISKNEITYTKQYNELNNYIKSKGDKEFLNYIINERHHNMLCEIKYSDPVLQQLTEEELLDIIVNYSTNLKIVDKQIERMYKEMENEGLNEDSFWVITAEHGEGLCNHSYKNHGKKVYNEQLNIPLLLHYPSSSESAVINDIVEHVDILPTLTDLLGINLENQQFPFQGSTLFSGKKINSKTDNDYAFSSTWGANIYALQNKDFKYIYNENDEDEFYDLNNDLFELKNIINLDYDEKELFKNEILRIKKNIKNRLDLKFIRDEVRIKHLEGMGYYK